MTYHFGWIYVGGKAQPALPSQTETICAGSFSYLHHMPEQGGGGGRGRETPWLGAQLRGRQGGKNLGTEGLFGLFPPTSQPKVVVSKLLGLKHSGWRGSTNRRQFSARCVKNAQRIQVTGEMEYLFSAKTTKVIKLTLILYIEIFAILSEGSISWASSI